MKLNEQIREYRKKAGLTQEQVANYLGVSTPAVNKWESGASCPDITLLAPIARLLQIDLNTLFTFHESLSREDVARFCNEIQSLAEANGFLAGFAAATARLREYPNSDLLRFSLALLMEGHLRLAALAPEDHGKYEKELMTWYDQAANGQDAETREAARGILVNKYLASGKIEKAQKLLDLLPDKRAVDKQMLQINILATQEKYEEAAILAERKIFSEIAALQSYFTKLVDIDLALNERDAAAGAAETSQKLAEIFGFWDYSAYVCPLQVSLAAKDVSKSTELIGAMLCSVLLPMSMPGMFRHLPTKPMADDFGLRMLSMLLHQFETDKDYDFLRADLDFQKLLAEYKSKLPPRGSGNVRPGDA